MDGGRGVNFGLPELLSLATRAVVENIHRRLADDGFDIRPAHGYIFQLLASTAGASGLEVADHLGVTKQAAAKLLDGLEQAGYIARRPDARDHRARLAILTEKGWAAVRSAGAAWMEVERAVERSLGSKHLADLKNDLARIADEGGALTPPLRLRPIW